MRSLLPVILALIALCWSCTDEDIAPGAPFDGNASPTMITDSVNTFVSDSGITRYHMIAPLWVMFDEADDPYWIFPQGLRLEQYDDHMHVHATVEADTARFFSLRKEWKLDGNVRMRNTDGDRFLTEQLFWNQRSHTVWSDSFIHIERANRILEGYGFISNEQITAYTIRRPTGIIPTDGFRRAEHLQPQEE